MIDFGHVFLWFAIVGAVLLLAGWWMERVTFDPPRELPNNPPFDEE